MLGRSLMRTAFAAVLAGILGVVPGARAAQPVDLELALAVDVSGSIDEVEAVLQRDGYIAAFRDPGVIRAITHGMLGRIAVAYYEWAGYGHMNVIVGWTEIGDAAGAHGFATELSKMPPQTAARTAIGEAIGFAIPYFDRNGFDGTRRVIDVSGDGPNNWGRPVTLARDLAVAARITINGLPIVNDRPSPFGWLPVRNLDLYYRDCVIGGPGAFMVVADSFKDFATAIRRKLILEIAGKTPDKGAAMANANRTPRRRARLHRIAQHRVAPPCDLGELRWRNRRDY